MKKANELIMNQIIKPQYSKEEYQKVTAFVASVYSLFTDYKSEFTKEDFFKDECRTWSKEILSFKNDMERLDKVKKLIAVSGMKGLSGCYKTPKQALAIACMPIEHINHDYRIAYSTSINTGELKRIGESVGSDLTQEQQIDKIKELKSKLFGGFSEI